MPTILRAGSPLLSVTVLLFFWSCIEQKMAQRADFLLARASKNLGRLRSLKQLFDHSDSPLSQEFHFPDLSGPDQESTWRVNHTFDWQAHQPPRIESISQIIDRMCSSQDMQCTQLYVLDLSANCLTQCILDKLETLPALSWLYLNNNFSGNLYSTIKQVSTNIKDISMVHKNLSGVISGYNFWPFQSLQLSLDLSHNMFSGPLPSRTGNLEFKIMPILCCSHI